MFGNQNRIKELETANQQWQQWYQSQQMQPQYQPQFQQPIQSAVKKKWKKKQSKRNNSLDSMSFEVKLWIFIILLSIFSVLVIKDWLTEIKTPERVEHKKLKTN